MRFKPIFSGHASIPEGARLKATHLQQPTPIWMTSAEGDSEFSKAKSKSESFIELHYLILYSLY
jgi:hypothetical protein